VARVSARFSKSLARHRFRPNQEKRRGEAIPDVAKLAGTSLDTPKGLDALAKLPPKKRDEIADRAKKGGKVSAAREVKKERRGQREADLAQRARRDAEIE
jgi:hypothetical protein